MARELLVLARPDTGRRGEIISEGPVGKQWGTEELNTDKFVIITVEDDDTDFLARYETGEQSLGAPDPKTGIPTVIKETAKKYSFTEAQVDEVLGADGKASIAVKDIINNEG